MWLQHVIQMLVGLHIHRVIVTNFSGATISVIAIRDVLAVLAEEPKGYFGTFFDD